MSTTTTTKYRPLNDRILVRSLESDGMTPGGIVLPDCAQADAMVFLVLASGPGHYDRNGTFIPNTIQEGDFILTQHEGISVPNEPNQKFFAGRDVLAIVED